MNGNNHLFNSYYIQKTINKPISFKGTGLHTGEICEVSIIPSPPNHGIIFVKDNKTRIFAHYDSVISTTMATSLGYKNDPSSTIATVEHILAALYASGVTNAEIRVFGPEIPILDGSSFPFLTAIFDSGLVIQPFSVSVIKIIKPIKIYQKNSICELLPRKNFRLTVSIDFPHPAVGPQTYAVDLDPKSFAEQIAAARTFGFLAEREKLWEKGLALGASLENVLAYSTNGIINPEGARFSDECVRHKLLDAIGDLSLSGSFIEGELVSFRGGHSVHLALLKSLLYYKSNWIVVPPQPLGVPTYKKSAQLEMVNYEKPHYTS